MHIAPDNTQMCFGFGACQGDTGGPLTCLIDQRWTLIGLFSYGGECGARNQPGVYSRISHPLFHNWLTKTALND